MSSIGFSELIILALIGLIILGPERLPKVANQIGTWLGQARRMTRVMKRQLEEELDLEGTNNIRPPSPPPSEKFPPKAASVPDVDPEPTPEVEPMPASEPYVPEEDDTYSAAHEADEDGTGVDDDHLYAEQESAVIEEPAAEEEAAEKKEERAS